MNQEPGAQNQGPRLQGPGTSISPQDSLKIPYPTALKHMSLKIFANAIEKKIFANAIEKRKKEMKKPNIKSPRSL